MMSNINNDLELKKMLVNRRKRLYCNLVAHLKRANARGAVSNEMLNAFRSCYNDFVFEEAKKEYLSLKMKSIADRKD